MKIKVKHPKEGEHIKEQMIDIDEQQTNANKMNVGKGCREKSCSQNQIKQLQCLKWRYECDSSIQYCDFCNCVQLITKMSVRLFKKQIREMYKL